MFPQIVSCLRQGREREGFRLVHYSVQSHHLHLLVEALNAQQLSLNARRHASQRGVKRVWNWIDPCSSGSHFDGWADRRSRPPPDEEPAVTAPGTWLLSAGWKRLGRIAINAIPGKR